MKKFTFCILTALLAGLTACGNHTKPAQGTTTVPASESNTPLTASAADLTAELQTSAVSGKETDTAFIAAQSGFALNLLKNTVKDKPAENVLISPYSVMQALAMTANGADGQTRTEMETALGSIPADTLNQYLYSYRTALPNTQNCKFVTANSVWFHGNKNRLNVHEDFLQSVKDYYAADAFSAPFDDSTIKDINQWCSNHTDNMIPGLLDKIPENTVMYLINAVIFDGKWQEPYKASQVHKEDFHNPDGKTAQVQMMHSDESVYIHDEKATGFIKPYDNSDYLFAALLPNDGVSLEDYVAGLTADSLQRTLSECTDASVAAGLPRFTVDFDTEMSDTLSAMGMPSAFSPETANLSKLADGEQLYISRVLHKTHIDVNPSGTKAAAVTAAEVSCKGIIESHSVILNRPFLYCILDGKTKLPLFIGTLNTLN